MKIRVTKKSTCSTWYNDHVGETFDVEEDNETFFVVRFVDGRASIKKENCVIVNKSGCIHESGGGEVITKTVDIGIPPAHKSKYHREIKPGVHVDVYDVLKAFEVNNPATAHAIKKLLAPGKRGVKSTDQDLSEAIDSIKRARELGR